MPETFHLHQLPQPLSQFDRMAFLVRLKQLLVKLHAHLVLRDGEVAVLREQMPGQQVIRLGFREAAGVLEVTGTY